MNRRPSARLSARLRRRAPTLAATALAALLAGCATSGPRPSTTSTVPVPETWSQPAPSAADAAPSADLASWWSRFDDPVLTRLVTDALAGNPDVRTAASRIAQSRATRGVEKSALFPTLSAGVSGSGRRTRDHVADTTTDSNSYSASLDASWEIDLFGKNRLALAAASADLAQTEENHRAAQASLSAEVALAYINLRSTESQLASVRRSIASREESTRLTQWREQAGVGDALDARQAESALEQARASIAALEQTLVEARNQLAVLCGRPPGSLDELLAAPAATAAIPHASTAFAVAIPAETLRQRPDIRAAARAVEAASTRSAAARRDRLPTLSLTGSLGVEAGEIGKLASPSATIASLAGNLVAPIFTAGRITQNIRIQDETTKQALIAYEAAVLDALAETENALSGVRRQDERLAALARAAAAARAADALARQQYEAGLADYLQVLESERTLLSLEQSLAATAADLGSAQVRLFKALGGGWSAEPPATTAPAPVASAQTAPAATL